MPCGVNLELFHPADKVSVRKRLGYAPDDIILLYVGRFEPLKGLDRLLEAMTHLQSHTKLRLLIVGGDGEKAPESQYLKEKTKSLGIEGKVTFAGRIEQEYLPPYYNSADVLVMPSHYESFGLVGLEALACGRPVVSAPVGAMERLIKNSRAGKVVKDSLPQSLARGIESVIDFPSLPSADKIRKSVLAYSWSNVAKDILKEYGSVLTRQSLEDDRLLSVEACC